jgi:hypothetical protein
MTYSYGYAVLLTVTEQVPWLTIRGVGTRLGAIWEVV